MCIFHSEEVKVTDNITVYKVVLKSIYDMETHWVTPFNRTMLSEDIISGKYPFIADDPSYVPEKNYGLGNIIGEGYIHAYATLKAAAKEYYLFYVNTIGPMYDVEVYECEIPADKGVYSHYCWKGTFDDTSLESMAAREMRFVRKVSPDELYDAFMKCIGI